MAVAHPSSPSLSFDVASVRRIVGQRSGFDLPQQSSAQNYRLSTLIHLPTGAGFEVVGAQLIHGPVDIQVRGPEGAGKRGCPATQCFCLNGSTWGRQSDGDTRLRTGARARDGQPARG
jgi:hypothetical protein